MRAELVSCRDFQAPFAAAALSRRPGGLGKKPFVVLEIKRKTNAQRRKLSANKKDTGLPLD